MSPNGFGPPDWPRMVGTVGGHTSQATWGRGE